MKHLFAAAGLALLLLPAPAQAQANRTWVSGTGADANPCSRTDPCKTFLGAILKTTAGGIISVLDAGGYGELTISKSINIVAEGAQAGIMVSGTNAVTVSVGTDDVVTLHGLFIEAATPGGIGVRVLSGAAVILDHCVIRGFATGISLDGAPGTKLYVRDTLIALNDTGVAANQGAAQIFLDGVRLVRNQTAIVNTGNPSTIHLHNSVLANNTLAIGTIAGHVLSTRTNALLGNGSNGARPVPEPLQ